MSQFYPMAAWIVLVFGACTYLLGGKVLETTKMASSFAAVIVMCALIVLLASAGGDTGLVRGILVDDYSRFLGVLTCLGALLSIMATSSVVEEERLGMIPEYYFLLLMSLCGALIMICASDFLTIFIGLEVTSLALYCLSGARIDKEQSSEAALKYFLMGCFSSAFFLYGIALWYGMTGTLALNGQIGEMHEPLLVLSFLLMVVGFAFKIGLAPFHFWVPDVYQGAPTSVTTYMSCIVKVAAFAALIKVGFVSFLFPSEWASSVLWVLSVLAMTIGNLAALQQHSVKRMLSYSSVAHAGYMLMGMTASSTGLDGISATLFYLCSYSAMTIGAFAVLAAIGPDVDDIEKLKGLGRRSPFLAAAMTLFCLALAGLPPGMAGLMGKIYLFSASLQGDFTGLAIIAALNSALACIYYFRVPMAMLFQDGRESERVEVPFMAGASISLCAALVVLLGCLPQSLLIAASYSAESIVHDNGARARLRE